MPLLTTKSAGVFGLGWSSFTPEPQSLDGLVLLEPSSISYSGGSASYGANSSVTMTGVSSISFNSVFSADYENYFVSINGVGSVDGAVLNMRTRTGTTDYSAANYNRKYLGVESGSASLYTNASLTYGTAARLMITKPSGFHVVIRTPFLSQDTSYSTKSFYSKDEASWADFFGIDNNSSSKDGVTFFTDTGTITGTIRIYGLVD